MYRPHSDHRNSLCCKHSRFPGLVLLILKTLVLIGVIIYCLIVMIVMSPEIMIQLKTPALAATKIYHPYQLYLPATRRKSPLSAPPLWCVVLRWSQSLNTLNFTINIFFVFNHNLLSLFVPRIIISLVKEEEALKGHGK